MPKFTLNGKPNEKEDGTTISQLLESLNLPAKTVIVELNREFLERDQFESTAIKEGDQLEIIRAFAGG